MIAIAFVVLFAAFLAECRLHRMAQKENCRLKDQAVELETLNATLGQQILNQADAMTRLEKVNESFRLALISKGGLVEVWPEYISKG